LGLGLWLEELWGGIFDWELVEDLLRLGRKEVLPLESAGLDECELLVMGPPLESEVRHRIEIVLAKWPQLEREFVAQMRSISVSIAEVCRCNTEVPIGLGVNGAVVKVYN
jgi:hypothetical protein